MLLSHLLFEPFHIIFALKKRFLKERLRIYKFFSQNLFKIMKNDQKENDLFDKYYEMAENARKKGFDPELFVESPQAKDLIIWA